LEEAPVLRCSEPRGSEHLEPGLVAKRRGAE
jgi:hypothetical protein